MTQPGAGDGGSPEPAGAGAPTVTATPAEAGVIGETATISASPKPSPKLRAVPTPPEPRELPPSILDRYEIIALLGRGGMGAVYQARDRRLLRDVALKILFRQGPDSAHGVLREARSQARLDHENVCKVFEAGTDGGVCHIAMAYIDGGPLGVAAARMILEEKVGVVERVARALHEAHRRGLVHGDVKPGNVMVEQRDDGSYKPYLVDFGIAREVGERGQTETGAVAGTPAFMAPEQARGEIHALDRRTDVYSLGATLFYVLTGRPPFAATSTWGLLDSIMNEEAPAVRSVSPEVPADLEAVVARCLEKAPHRRYDSANALGDDLVRFLDGDPVRARRLSPGYVVFRKARKHRAGVALASAALLAVLVVVALWARERRLAAARTNLARELGEDVKEMELFLRGAFELPLHDVEREKDVVRARLGGIEARIAALGPAGEGPGHYALGRGYLALQEPEEARPHLEKASAAGYASPELDYALGLSLGELYTEAIEETKRIEDPERKKARLAAIEAEYAEPALRHLRASLGARLEAPAYVEGLIALYEGKPEEALAKAREASAARPWLYEVKKLEGDAHFALGSRFRHDAAFDHDRMMIDFQAAAEAYAAAAEIARSDPRVHEAECRLWAQVMNAATERRESLRPSHERARAACGRAMTASSRSDRAHLDLALVQVAYAWWIATGVAAEDPEAALNEAIALGEDAVRRSPRDPMAPYVMAEAQRSEARYLTDRGLDGRSAVDGAIASYEQAVARDGTFLWAVNDLAYACSLKAEIEISRGLDPTASLERAVAESRRARDLDRGFLGAYAHESIAHLLMAEHLVDTGRDPAAAIVPWRAAALAGKALSQTWPWADYHAAYQAWLEARYALDSGKDPGALLEEGTRIADEALKRSPSALGPSIVAGQLGLTRALHLLGRGEDPGPALGVARVCFDRAMEVGPWDVGFRVFRGRVEIVGLRWAAKAHEPAAERFQAARAPLLPLLDRERVDGRLYQTLGEIDAIEAAWSLDAGKSADDAIAAGLGMAAKALALNPSMARAFATEGALLLLRARAARDPQSRLEAKRGAEEALAAAVRNDPLLVRELRIW